MHISSKLMTSLPVEGQSRAWSPEGSAVQSCFDVSVHESVEQQDVNQ